MASRCLQNPCKRFRWFPSLNCYILSLSLPSAHLVMVWIFIDLSLNCIPHIIIKEIPIWQDKQSDIRANKVSEIFSQPKLGSSACVAWRRVLLLDVMFFIRQSLDPEEHYPLQALFKSLRVDSKFMSKDECRHNVTITSNHSKYNSVDWKFGFHHFQYIFWTVVLWVHHLIQAEIYSKWEKSKHV